MTPADSTPVGLSPQAADALLARALSAEGRAAEAERECNSLRRDILHQSNELIHLRRTLGHETARCDVMQAELTKAGSVAVRHPKQE